MKKSALTLKSITPLIFLSFLSISANAGVIPLTITSDASIEYDETNSFNDSGHFELISAGSATSSTSDDGTVTGDNPLTGPFSHTGDKIDIRGSASTSNDDFLIGFDGLVSFENTSLTDTYEVFFTLDYSNRVTSSGRDGNAYSEFSLEVNGDEWFTQLLSDSSNGNEIAGEIDDGNGGDFGVGGSLSEAATELFSVEIDPGDFFDIEFFWTSESIDNFEGDSIVSFNSSLTLDSVVNLSSPQPPTGVPEPQSIFLFAFGLLAFSLVNKKLNKNS